MNKSDLIEELITKSHLACKRAEAVVNLMFDEMAAALARDERIEIRGLGSFVCKHYRARAGRNPRTGETIPVPAKRLPFFKVGKELRQRVDQIRRGRAGEQHATPGAAPASAPAPAAISAAGRG